MQEIFGQERLCIRPFCKSWEEEVILISALEGRMGRVWVDDREMPHCSLVINGDFCYLLGEYRTSQQQAIVDIISDLCPGKIIQVEEPWEPILAILELQFPNSFRSFNRYALQGRPEWFNRMQLEKYAKATEPDFRIVKADEKIYHLTVEQAWTQDFCNNFNSAQDFLDNGKGYFVLEQGEIIAGASSYSYSDGRIEVNIETREEYRKRGLALACASKLILECLEDNILPRWDAANMASVALAEKLGYRFDHEYVVYTI